MGTLAKSDARPKFDRTVKMWPLFKEAMLKWADGEGFGYMLEGGQGICTIFQAASAAAAKSAAEIDARSSRATTAEKLTLKLTSRDSIKCHQRGGM